VDFFSAIRIQNNIAESRAKISQVLVQGLHKIFEKFSQNSFFLKFHVRISTEFVTKRDKFQVKRMSIHPRKKSNSLAPKRTFLSALARMNKNLFPIFWDEYGAQISSKNQQIQ